VFCYNISFLDEFGGDMSDYADIAKKYFNGKEYHNCTQAILRVYQEDCNISDEVIANYKEEGGSHVASGICGALFAAYYLLGDDKEAIENITKSFSEKFGSIKCSELRLEEREMCSRYVEYVALWLEKNYRP